MKEVELIQITPELCPSEELPCLGGISLRVGLHIPPDLDVHARQLRGKLLTALIVICPSGRVLVPQHRENLELLHFLTLTAVACPLLLPGLRDKLNHSLLHLL